MAHFGLQQIVGYRCVVVARTEVNAEVFENDVVAFDIVAHYGGGIGGKQGAQRCNPILAAGLVIMVGQGEEAGCATGHCYGQALQLGGHSSLTDGI